jgi:hypothetical protein
VLLQRIAWAQSHERLSGDLVKRDRLVPSEPWRFARRENHQAVCPKAPLFQVVEIASRDRNTQIGGATRNCLDHDVTWSLLKVDVYVAVFGQKVGENFW